MQLAEIPELIRQQTQAECSWDEKNAQITVGANDLVAICDVLWRHPETYFDSLSCLTAIDLGPEQGQIEVIYTLYSIPKHKPTILLFHNRIASQGNRKREFWGIRLFTKFFCKGQI